MLQNLTWSGFYPRSTLSNNILHMTLAMVAITITGTKVYASIVKTVLSDSNNTLEETLNFLKSLKLKSYLEKKLHIAVLRYWMTLIDLIVPGPLSLTTSTISLKYLRIIMIIDSVS